MASPHASARSTASLRLAAWGGWSSLLLRPAAGDDRATGGRRGLWQGFARALRAAGPDRRSSPLHGLLCDVDSARGSDPGQHLRGG